MIRFSAPGRWDRTAQIREVHGLRTERKAIPGCSRGRVGKDKKGRRSPAVEKESISEENKKEKLRNHLSLIMSTEKTRKGGL